MTLPGSDSFWSVLVLLLVLALGAALGWFLAWQQAGVALGSSQTEAELLRSQLISVTDEYRSDRALASTLAPIAQSLSRMEEQVTQLERDRLDQFARLDAQLSEVRSSGESLRQQTSHLAGALRNSSARGAWGEVQLKRVIEHAGMLARVDFDTQVVGTTSSGASIRPDVIVHLPGHKYVVIDAKAPLEAFLESSEHSTDPALQSSYLQRHAKAVRGHVDSLAAKEYWTAFTPTPELVVCFVPGEAFLAAACAQDPALLEYAMSKRVVLATPTTLMALLRTVALTWQSDALSSNAQELFELGQDLYRRLGALGTHASKLGRSVARVVEDYNAVIGSLENSVLMRARRMHDLDVVLDPLPELATLDVSPRLLTAAELIADREMR